MLGAPQGYVGYGDGAQLVDALSANPRTVVLFDEIEKAHPDILRTLMNAMDAGRLSTPSAQAGRSRHVDCRQAIFLFTSNLDPAGILQSLSEHRVLPDPHAVDEICRTQLGLSGFSPELVGRMSCFLVFRPLTVEVRAEIIALAIASVASEYGIEIRHIESSVILHFLEKARDDRFGARPFEYLIDEVLGDCFAVAAASPLGTAVTLEGPPFRCAASRPADAGSENTGPEGPGG
jgi:ATP-dependent Clp protease ATP-binding subunit ClpA